MSPFSDRLSTLRADLRQRLQFLRARIERARGAPFHHRGGARGPGWEESSSWSDENSAPPPPSSLDTPPDGMLSRPRTVREATERLLARRSLIRRQQTRRPL